MAKAKTWEEYKVECEAVAKPGIQILGWVGDWKGSKSKLRCSCEEHGEWITTSIYQFKAGRSCPVCRSELIGKRNSLPDSTLIAKFMATGKFKPGTKFWRESSSRDGKGKWSYTWSYTCPTCSHDYYVTSGLCSGVFTASYNSLKSGRLSCRCSVGYRWPQNQMEHRLKMLCEMRGFVFNNVVGKYRNVNSRFSYICKTHGIQNMRIALFINGGRGCPLCAGKNQQQCYINVVMDDFTPVALKVGIAKDANARLKSLNRCNLFHMQQVAVYDFPTVRHCKQAERACLSELVSGVLSSRELKNGYTETVALTDYDKVVSIYERFGGVRVDTNINEGGDNV